MGDGDVAPASNPLGEVDYCTIASDVIGALSIDVDTLLSLQSQALSLLGVAALALIAGAVLLFGPALAGDGSVLKVVHLFAFVASLVIGAWGCKVVGLPGALAGKIPAQVECAATLFLLLLVGFIGSASAKCALSATFFAIGAAAGVVVSWVVVGAATPYAPELAEQKYAGIYIADLVAIGGAVLGGCVFSGAKEKLFGIAAAVAGAILMTYGLLLAFVSSGYSTEVLEKLQFREYYSYYYVGVAGLLLLLRFKACQGGASPNKPLVMR